MHWNELLGERKKVREREGERKKKRIMLCIQLSIRWAQAHCSALNAIHICARSNATIRIAACRASIEILNSQFWWHYTDAVMRPSHKLPFKMWKRSKWSPVLTVLRNVETKEIRHDEVGTIVVITDTYWSRCNHWIQQKKIVGSLKQKRRSRPMNKLNIIFPKCRIFISVIENVENENDERRTQMVIICSHIAAVAFEVFSFVFYPYVTRSSCVLARSHIHSKKSRTHDVLVCCCCFAVCFVKYKMWTASMTVSDHD